MTGERSVSTEKTGIALVFGSALAWSFGGTIARFLDIVDPWTMVFYRAMFAGLFLVTFLLLRDGPRATIGAFTAIRFPGLAVAFGFATASTSFVIAISYTTVANVILIQASIPLLAALMSWVIFRERIAFTTWAAIVAVIFGVGIMVSESLGGDASWIGNVLALVIAIVFAMVTVVTRRYTNVRMTPAAAVGCFASMTVAATQASSLSVTTGELGILFIFGAFNLGLGMALFVTGARLIPSALAALLGTAEAVLAPVWVALVHGEVPGPLTFVGGTFVLAALIVYLWLEFRKQSQVPVRRP